MFHSVAQLGSTTLISNGNHRGLHCLVCTSLCHREFVLFTYYWVYSMLYALVSRQWGAKHSQNSFPDSRYVPLEVQVVSYWVTRLEGGFTDSSQ